MENINLTFKWSLIDQSPQDEERAKGKGIDSGRGSRKKDFSSQGQGFPLVNMLIKAISSVWSPDNGLLAICVTQGFILNV